MNCPECGAPFPWQARFAQLVVCESCRTSSHVDEDALRIVGKMAALAHTPGPLYLNGSGTWRGRRFTVVGRVRYQYGQGFWDEWMLSFADGDTRWVGEDEGELTIMRPQKSGRARHLFDQATPGARLSLGERTYHVDEKSVARCAGGEGQLPFVIGQDDEIGYAELSSGDKRVATIEVDSDGEARLYLGLRALAKDFEMDEPLDDAERAAYTAGLDSGGAVTGAKAVTLGCMNCGAPLPEKAPLSEKTGAAVLDCEYCGIANESELPHTTCPSCQTSFVVPGGSDAPLRVCPKCSQFIDCTGGQVRAIEPGGAPMAKAATPFKMGQPCTLQGDDYVLTGHLRTREQDAWGVYYTNEYFLFHPDKGYRTLEEENGHWTLSERLTEAPFMPSDTPKDKFTYDGKTFKIFEAGSNLVDWVNGQLPYVAKLGDASRYVDAIRPPQLLSKSESEGEVEYFLGSYLQPEAVAEAFGLNVDDLPARTGVAPNQPHAISSFRKFAKLVALVTAIVNLVLLIWAAGQGTVNASLKIQFEPEAGESATTTGPSGEYFSDPFTIAKANTLCELEINCPVHNNWAYIDVAVVNEKGQVVHELGADISYYEGYEGGEHWSEGSQTVTETIMLTEPGSYRLLMRREASNLQPVTVTVHESIVLYRYILLLMFASIGWAGVELGLKYTFEKRRWPQEDDDDD